MIIRRHLVFRFNVPMDLDPRAVCLGEQAAWNIRHIRKDRAIFAALADAFQTEPTLARILGRV